MAQIELWINQDLQKPAKVHHIDGSFFTTFEVCIVKRRDIAGFPFRESIIEIALAILNRSITSVNQLLEKS